MGWIMEKDDFWYRLGIEAGEAASKIVAAITPPQYVRKVMENHEQRECAFAQLAAASSNEFAERCWKIVRADANTYGIECEIYRMSMATRLFLDGVSESAILQALENQVERFVLLNRGIG